MMKVVIEFTVDNSAFTQEDGTYNMDEISRTIINVGRNIDNITDSPRKIRDAYGNTVGSYVLKWEYD